MGLHRTLLFLLAVGLIIAAFRRGGGGVPSSQIRAAPPPAAAKPGPTAPVLTNSTTGRGLAAAGHEAKK